MANKRSVGAHFEDVACEYLEKNGVRVVDRNYKRYRGGEIDIIAREPDGCLLFIEVKYRNSDVSGMPGEAVSFYKQRNICRASDLYRRYKGIGEDEPVRYDVITIENGKEITWIRNAFDYIL